MSSIRDSIYFEAEILIQDNVNIQGFKHKNSDKEIKNIQQADDMTPTLKILNLWHMQLI